MSEINDSDFSQKLTGFNDLGNSNKPNLATEKIDFRDQLSKLKKGIAVSWIVNFIILMLTLEAALIVAFNNSLQNNIQMFFVVTLPISALLSLIVTLLVSHFSYKTIMLTASPKAIKVSDGPIYNLVEEMCVSAGFSQKDYPTLYIDPTNETNAYALSSPKGSLIIVTEGLINILNREELQAVIAHELGHVISGDSKAMTKIVAMTSFVAFIAGGFRYMFYSNNSNKGNNNNPIAIVITVIAIIFLVFAPLLSMIANAFMSRQRETQADTMSVRLTRNPTALAKALIKIDNDYSKSNNHKKENKNKTKQKDKQKFSDGAGHLAFFSVKKGLRTHPPTDERVKILRSMGAEIN